MRVSTMTIAFTLLSVLVYCLDEYRPSVSWRVRIVTEKKLPSHILPTSDVLVTELQDVAKSLFNTMTQELVGILVHSVVLALQTKVRDPMGAVGSDSEQF